MLDSERRDGKEIPGRECFLLIGCWGRTHNFQWKEKLMVDFGVDKNSSRNNANRRLGKPNPALILNTL